MTEPKTTQARLVGEHEVVAGTLMTKPKTTQDAPTKPRAVDGAGRQLDDFGLPLSGPARARALAEIGKPDPRDDPDAWKTPARKADAGDKKD